LAIKFTKSEHLKRTISNSGNHQEPLHNHLSPPLLKQNYRTRTGPRESFFVVVIIGAAANMATPRKQAPFATAQHRHNVSGQAEKPTTTPSTDLFSTAYAKAICFVIASALCQALAGRTQLAICNSNPWWLGHVAGLVIRAHGAETVNKLGVVGGRGFLLHLLAFGLGWALDYIFRTIYNDI
jgi:hypothetical protein